MRNADARPTRSSASGAHATPVQWIVRRALGLVAIAFLGLLLSLVIEYVGLTFVWPEAGATHALGLLDAELSYLDADFRRGIAGATPVELALTFSHSAYHYSGLAWLLGVLSMPPASPSPTLNQLLVDAQATVGQFSEYVSATVYVVQLYGVRIAVVLMTLPVFALFGMVGLVDGLVQRDLRRFRGGVESAFLYHHLKRWLVPIVSLTVLAYLSVPMAVHPNYVFVPAAFVFAVVTAHTVERFKKFV